MDKYRNNSASLNSSTKNRLLNTGPLYTMGSNSQQQQGPKLLMNSVSVGTSTKFQFVPARNSSTNFQFGVGSITPIFNTVKTFFVNLIKSSVDVETNSTHNIIEKRKCNSAPNIYMDIMSDRKLSDDFEKNCAVDLTDLDMLTKLSSSTKSFSDFNLPIKINNTPKPQPQQVTKKMDLNISLDEPQAKPTKEVVTETTVPVVESSSVPVAVSQQKVPNVLTTFRTQLRNGKRTKKEKMRKSNKDGKNKKETKRHELALNIHKDVETEHETMSTDEWDDEPLVIISASKTAQCKTPERITPAAAAAVTFSKDDFPAMSESKALNIKNNSIEKQVWYFPMTHCSSSFNRNKQISECDSEDSFIVFDNDDGSKSMPSSVESNRSFCDRIRNSLLSGRHRQISEISESSDEDDDDDFICFEMENSDNDDDDDAINQIVPPAALSPPALSPAPLSSALRDEVDAEVDSGFGDRKVRFNLIPTKRYMCTWTFAHFKARKGEWEQCARDRVRFHDRIKRLESTLAPILDFDHRLKIYCKRYLNQADNDTCNGAIEK